MTHLGIVELRALAAFHTPSPLILSKTVEIIARGHLNDNALFMDGISGGKIYLAVQLFLREGKPVFMVKGLTESRIGELLGRDVTFLKIEVAPQTVIFQFAVSILPEQQKEVSTTLQSGGASEVVHMGYTTPPEETEEKE